MVSFTLIVIFSSFLTIPTFTTSFGLLVFTYDVKSVKISGDIVLLAVLADNAESGLVQKIQNYFGINNKHESKIPEKFNKLFSLIYIISTLNFTVLLNRINQNLFFSFSENIVCNYSDIIILPPKKI